MFGKPKGPFPIVALYAALLTSCDTLSAPENRVAFTTHPSGVVAARLSLGGRPHGVACSETGIFVVSQIDGDLVTYGTLDGTRSSLVATIPVGNTPAHVAIDRTGRMAYTTNQYGNSVSVINLELDSLVASIPLSDGGFNLIISADGERVFATTASGWLHIIDTRMQRVIHTMQVGRAANGLALHEPSGILYVSSRNANRVTAIDIGTYQIVRTYSVSEGPQRIAVSTGGTRLYVANEVWGVDVVDTGTGNITMIPGVLPGAVGLALSPDNEQVYVANPPRGLIQIVDLETSRVVSTIDAAISPRNVTFNSDGSYALVTDESGFVLIIR